MNLYKYDKRFYKELSDKTGFQSYVLEKVHRLTIILDFINSHDEINESLALKGGTSINLTIFNMPRLSVDIDMDFCAQATKEEMLKDREKINKILLKYFETEKYVLKPKSKNPHALDSWVLGYQNVSENNDIIKVEINYSLREHILPTEQRKIATDIFEKERAINNIAALEIFAGKIAALLNRTAARDLYDIYNLVKFGMINLNEYDLLRKCVIFYKLLSSDTKEIDFDVSVIDKLTKYKIKRDLIPMLRKKEAFDLDKAKKEVHEFLKELLILTDEEKEFIHLFVQGKYMPQMLFKNEDIVDRVKNHPMVMWKMQNIKRLP